MMFWQRAGGCREIFENSVDSFEACLFKLAQSNTVVHEIVFGSFVCVCLFVCLFVGVGGE